MNKSAGIIIILNKSKVLLCRSSNSILSSTYSFPKGGIEKGEKKIDAAIREVFEETSIVVNKKQITNRKEPIVINYINKKGFNYKRVYLYKVYINEISEIMLNSEIIPFDRLQLGEVDWAGFLTKEEAMPKIFHRVKHLLDLII
jgi:8-oxo-dGTP pyrophosphatase MutT (NUDIX family)